MKLFVFALLASAVSSFAPTSSVNRQTLLRESFGFDFAEDSYANQPKLLRGEQEYKQFVNKYAENNMLNRKVSYFVEYTFIAYYFFLALLSDRFFRVWNTNSTTWWDAFEN